MKGNGERWDSKGRRQAGQRTEKKALTEKISAGIPAEVIDLPELSEIAGADMPPVKDYLKAKQKGGKDLCAAEVYEETWKWLKDRGASGL